MPRPEPVDPSFVACLLASYQAATSRPLVPAHLTLAQAASYLYDQAPFAVLAHDAGDDPRFVYANRAAQACFERPWDELVGMPSRLSAEPVAQPERAAMLAQVSSAGFATGYRGVRIAKSGRRFWIEDGTLWNVVGPHGARLGQAATFSGTSPV